MRIPCRCNKRSCQARRTLRKRPEQYVREPKCHIPGCDGKMYVDEYRLRKGEFDNPPQCTDPNCNFTRRHFERTGRVMIRPHRVSNDLCDHYQEWITKRNMAPRSKHSPIPENEWIPF